MLQEAARFGEVELPTMIRGVYHRGTRPPQVMVDVRMVDKSLRTVVLEDAEWRYPHLDLEFIGRTVLASAVVLGGPLVILHQINLGSAVLGYFLDVIS